ncbi:hypothetical protein [Tuwongella immobilis]|uniref:Uncharacterized protein n=1 Tax=Tuwongella immobilis TaxID=692036 RepID=A0A6C2YL46_9BACT|nr:hypothetical protein [Tuwongella immobilis]VIP02298.1 unnamed protein product [Tuwongella immobilis]VTS00980.1 unnamed protein product [Tuwongella immobilis]
MEAVRELLETIRQKGLIPGHLRGVFNLLIGRTITRLDGTPISKGLTWRELSTLLRELRWEKSLVRELGLDPDTLSPRDRDRFWFQAIASANVNSPLARQQADSLAERLESHGFHVVPLPPASRS